MKVRIITCAMLSVATFLFSSTAFANRNLEPQLCYGKIEQAYRDAALTKTFILEDPEICGKYKYSYDNIFKTSEQPKYFGEESFDELYSYPFQSLKEKSFEARKACQKYISSMPSPSTQYMNQSDCSDFIQLNNQIKMVPPP